MILKFKHSLAIIGLLALFSQGAFAQSCCRPGNGSGDTGDSFDQLSNNSNMVTLRIAGVHGNSYSQPLFVSGIQQPTLYSVPASVMVPSASFVIQGTTAQNFQQTSSSQSVDLILGRLFDRFLDRALDRLFDGDHGTGPDLGGDNQDLKSRVDDHERRLQRLEARLLSDNGGSAPGDGAFVPAGSAYEPLSFDQEVTDPITSMSQMLEQIQKQSEVMKAQNENMLKLKTELVSQFNEYKKETNQRMTDLENRINSLP